jgi:Fe-S cluster biogenesis protein NfuA/nitrite reductase/ring-hydroxylating ferredoxin subunit
MPQAESREAESRAASDEGLIDRVQELSSRLESLPDGPARSLAEELVAAVVQMYGSGLERIVAAVAEAGPAGEGIRDALAADPVVASLLLIHDLYPVPLEERVMSALDTVRPYMESHGGNVELLGVENGIARLRLEGSCSSCKASSATLELAVRQALEEAAPDLAGMDVEGVLEPEDPLGIPLPLAGNGVPPPAPSWFSLDGASGLSPEQLMATEVAGTPLVVANVEGTLLAYRNACAGCGERLDAAVLTAGALACPSCGRSYYLPRAGRSLDDDRLQLEPVPLLRDEGSVTVALSA